MRTARGLEVCFSIRHSRPLAVTIIKYRKMFLPCTQGLQFLRRPWGIAFLVENEAPKVLSQGSFPLLVLMRRMWDGVFPK